MIIGKNSLAFLLAVIVLSCIKEYELIIPSEELVAVRCLFTPDSCWKVKVYQTYSTDNSITDNIIDNAEVSIKSEGNERIVLEQKEDGLYYSDLKPEAGITYNLTVKIEGYPDITSESYVPYRKNISNLNFDNNPGPVRKKLYLSDDYGKVTFNILTEDESLYYSKLTVKLFNSGKGFNIYCINNEIFNSLNNIPNDILHALKALDGRTLYEYDLASEISNIINQEDQFYYRWLVMNHIRETSQCGRLDYRHPDLFYTNESFSHSGLFYQVANNETVLLLAAAGVQEAELYTYNQQEDEIELWLEYSDISTDYYKFWKDYLLQVSNRGEISSAPVVIYNNIQNGVGIFAGYQTQRFLLTRN